MLKRALDPDKDQSYFLYIMGQKELRRTIMPLGRKRKEEVRGIAASKGIHVHEKPESQEICFIDGRDYRRFFEKNQPDLLKPGPIKAPDGKVLGTHAGIVCYTIGQRRGLGISARHPLYVTGIDRESNSLHVGPRNLGYRRELWARNVNWTLDQGPSGPVEIDAKIRSIHEPSRALLEPQEGSVIKLTFEEPQWAITPGQAAVFYSGDTVLGGGTISETR
jgi:tRNA-specific 2-thiouridylase